MIGIKFLLFGILLAVCNCAYGIMCIARYLDRINRKLDLID